MPWTQEDEEKYQREKSEWFAERAREDEEKRQRADMGLSAKCPECGSHRYIEATHYEGCDDCGMSQSY